MVWEPSWRSIRAGRQFCSISKITSGYTESEVQGEKREYADSIGSQDTRKITIHERTGRRDVILGPKRMRIIWYLDIRGMAAVCSRNSQEDEKSKIYEEASGNEMQFRIWQGKRWESVSGRCFLGYAPCEKEFAKNSGLFLRSQIQTRNESVCIC